LKRPTENRRASRFLLTFIVYGRSVWCIRVAISSPDVYIFCLYCSTEKWRPNTEPALSSPPVFPDQSLSISQGDDTGKPNGQGDEAFDLGKWKVMEGIGLEPQEKEESWMKISRS
jgi:hypothetical protein